MTLTKKGRAKCDVCGRKQKDKDDFTYLILIVEFDGELGGQHFCSWECILDTAAAHYAADLEASDFTGD